MDGQPTLLLYGEDRDRVELPESLRSFPIRSLTDWSDLGGLPVDQDVLLYLSVNDLPEAGHMASLLEATILRRLPLGIALLDLDGVVQWANPAAVSLTTQETLTGRPLHRAWTYTQEPGGARLPLERVITNRKSWGGTLQVEHDKHVAFNVVPHLDRDGTVRSLIVTLRDATGESIQAKKMAAIHEAGSKLASLTPAEVCEMTVEDRILIVKENILHYVQSVFHFDVIEIRLLDQKTRQLKPLLAFGLDEEAENRELFASVSGNGVTGYVAATGRSYLCHSARHDPLYLVGFHGARSSLTVPLMMHDEVIGTFNVESPEEGAFSDDDVQYVETFSRDIAGALNTLNLLVAQQANATAESVEKIHRAVALPVDVILNDAVTVMEMLNRTSHLTESLNGTSSEAASVGGGVSDGGSGDGAGGGVGAALAGLSDLEREIAELTQAGPDLPPDPLGPDLPISREVLTTRLRRILSNARAIRRVIQSVGQRMAPTDAVLVRDDITNGYPVLHGLRMLVVDSEEETRTDAHELLERYGCIVETATDGQEAICMLRSCAPEEMYRVIISDIRLPDMKGWQFYEYVKQIIDPAPVILAAGFGHDPGHSFVKARDRGHDPKAKIFKPFRPKQLIEVTELMAREFPPPVVRGGNGHPQAGLGESGPDSLPRCDGYSGA